MKQKKYVFFTVSILLSLILSIQVYAVGDGNLDGGGGSMGQGTIQNSWSPGNEGVRVTVIRADDDGTWNREPSVLCAGRVS